MQLEPVAQVAFPDHLCNPTTETATRLRAPPCATGAAPRKRPKSPSSPLSAPKGAHYFSLDAGGVLLDRAVYGYAAALRLLGPVASQTVFIDRDASGLDRSAEMRLAHETGGRSVLTLSFDRLGSNRLDVATEAGYGSLMPSLGAEALQWKPHKGGFTPGASGGFKDRLKARPVMRRINRHLQQHRWRFLSYGASLYAPILQEFHDTFEKGGRDSEIAPLALSREIAALTDEARRQELWV